MDIVVHIQGDPGSSLTPLILIHAISGLALPYFALGPLSTDTGEDDTDRSRPVYGLSSPIFESVSAFRRHGKSLPSLALEYVRIIRREIQPRGPYLLGGWSMGGMLAIEMAAILVAQGETVKHVVMIDSLNPEVYPPFQDSQEHQVLSTIMYNAIAWRVQGLEEAGMPALSDDASTTTSSDNSRASIDHGADSEVESEADLDDFMQQLREHVHQGMRILASYHTLHRGVSLPGTAVTLIKCTMLGNLSPLLRASRKAFAKKNLLDPHNGWRTEQFKSFRSVPFASTHDACFDAEASEELTTILRGVLKDMD